jgi:hypothetical protein
VLANGDTGQAEALGLELERWLRPLRGDAAHCPSHGHPVGSGGEQTLALAGDDAEGSYVAVPFPAYDKRTPVEAQAALLLLNRSGGWLDQALNELSASATALLVGGPDAAALIVEVVATESQRAPAVERLRGLFERLATGKIAASDADFARRELERSDMELFDPRRRVIATWRGLPARAERPVLDAARLTQWLATLRRSGAVVVNVAPRG